MTATEEQTHYYDASASCPTNAAAAPKLRKDDPPLGPVVEAAEKSVATPVHRRLERDPAGAEPTWSVQSDPVAEAGTRSTDEQLDRRLADAQKTADTALSRAK